MEAELVDVTDADQEEADCEEEVVATQTPDETGTQTPYATSTNATSTETRETTEASAAAPASAVTSSLLKTRGRPAKPQLQTIPITKDAFKISKKYGPRSQKAATKAESRAFKAIVDDIIDDSHTLERQVLALRQAIKHKRMKLISTSAGLFAGSAKDSDAQIVTNIKDTLQFARKTDSMFGRTNDDNGSLVHFMLFYLVYHHHLRERNSL